MDTRARKAFWSGIAAPGMLFAADTPKISRVEFIRHDIKSDVESMRSDWVAIGKDIRTVMTNRSPK